MNKRIMTIFLSFLIMLILVFIGCQENDQPSITSGENDKNPAGRDPASISGLLPTEGFLKDVITITGSGFDTTPANNLVQFGNKVGVTLTASATELTVETPNISDETVTVSVSIRGSEFWSNVETFTFKPTLVIIDDEISWHNGIAVDTDDNVYIGSANDGIIYKIDTAGTKTEFASSSVSGSMKFGPGNSLYVCEQGEGKIVKISSDGSNVEDYVFVESPVSFDWDANGDMFIVSNWIEAEEEGGIFKYDGSNVTQLLTLPSPKNCRVFGNYLYVNDIWEGRIVKFEITSGGLGDLELVLETDSPSALEFDVNGKMYYAQAWETSLYTLEPDGTEGEILYEGELMTPMRYFSFHNKTLYIVYPGWGDVGQAMSAYIGVEQAPNYGLQ